MNEDFYINLIYQKISGEINKPDLQKLNNWLSESEENKLTARSIELAWENSEETAEIPNVNLDSEFSFLEERIEEDQKEEKKKTSISEKDNLETGKTRKLSTVWISLAAGIAVLLSIGFLLQQQFSAPALEWAEISTTNNTEKIRLSDHTEITLNRNSTLRYPKEFPAKERRVKIEGEAFFDVAKNTEKPFIIEAQSGEIKILGTSFNVRDYEDETYASVYVVTGKVQFKAKNTSDKVVLSKGNKGILDKSAHTLKKTENVSSNEISWFSKRLEFMDTPFNKVLAQAERMYNVKFKLLNPDIRNCMFTATFKGSSLEVFLETITGVLEVEINKVDEGLYELKGGICL